MAHTLSILNQKGGVGKTTTALNLGAALAHKGKCVLLIDIDPQGNLSQSIGIDNLAENEPTIYEVLLGWEIEKAIRTRKTDAPYDVIPCDIRLANGAQLFSKGKNRTLQIALKMLKKQYDYILIDCPPSLDIFSVMALVASNGVIVPLQASYLPLKGVAQLRDIVEVIRKNFNATLEICGILLTFFDMRRNLDKEVLNAAKEAFPDRVFQTTISLNSKLAEAPSQGMDIFEYAPNSKGALQYMRLAEEIITQKN